MLDIMIRIRNEWANLISTLEPYAVKVVVVLRLALLVVWRLVRNVILAALVLIPIVCGFAAGLAVALIVRMTIAVVEGYQAGQKLINGG